MLQNWPSERESVDELVPISCVIVPTLAMEPLWEPVWSSHRCS